MLHSTSTIHCLIDYNSYSECSQRLLMCNTMTSSALLLCPGRIIVIIVQLKNLNNLVHKYEYILEFGSSILGHTYTYSTCNIGPMFLTKFYLDQIIQLPTITYVIATKPVTFMCELPLFNGEKGIRKQKQVYSCQHVYPERPEHTTALVGLSTPLRCRQ